MSTNAGGRARTEAAHEASKRFFTSLPSSLLLSSALLLLNPPADESFGVGGISAMVKDGLGLLGTKLVLMCLEEGGLVSEEQDAG